MADKHELERLRNAIEAIEAGAQAASASRENIKPSKIARQTSTAKEGVAHRGARGSSSKRADNQPSQAQNASGEPPALFQGDVRGGLDVAASEQVDEPPIVTRAMLRAAALGLLAQREQSEGELLKKLGKRFPGNEQLKTEVIAELQADGLQSDARLAEAYVRYRSQRGQGPNKIRNELSQKGVSTTLILESLSGDRVDWFDLARLVLEKRFGESQASSTLEAKERARRSRFLQQRGFHYEHISASL